MVDFTSEEWMNRAIDIVEPIFKKLEQKGVHYTQRKDWDALEPSDYIDMTEMAVYAKCREVFLRKLRDELGVEYVNTGYAPEVLCDEGFLFVKSGHSTYTLEEGYWDTIYDIFADEPFLPCGPFFWQDCFEVASGYETVDDLQDYYFTGDGLEEYFHQCEFLDLKDMSYEDFCEKYPNAVVSLQQLWKKQYSEEMTKELYRDLRGLFEELTDEECNFRYQILVNVAIKPFLKTLWKDAKLRKEKASKFAILLIKNLRWCSPYSNVLDDIMYGFTDNLFFCTQQIGSNGYSEIFPLCLSLRSEIALSLIDYVIAYLDKRYCFLPPDVRQMWRKSKTRTVNP